MQDKIYDLQKRRAAKVGLVPPHNLPAQLTPLIGREQETQTICAILRRPETHLLTLLGTGGVGKTRLGLRIAIELLHDFPAGVFFIALAPTSDPELVIPAIAQTLGLRETPDRSPLEQVKEYFENVSVISPCLARIDYLGQHFIRQQVE